MKTKTTVSDLTGNSKFQLLNVTFNNTYKKCLQVINEFPNHYTDRNLFVNHIEIMLDSLKEANTIKSPLIVTGFNNQFKIEFEELKRLEESMKNRNMI